MYFWNLYRIRLSDISQGLSLSQINVTFFIFFSFATEESSSCSHLYEPPTASASLPNSFGCLQLFLTHLHFNGFRFWISSLKWTVLGQWEPSIFDLSPTNKFKTSLGVIVPFSTSKADNLSGNFRNIFHWVIVSWTANTNLAFTTNSLNIFCWPVDISHVASYTIFIYMGMTHCMTRETP